MQLREGVTRSSEERIRMWIMSGGDAEVAAALKKKRFLQKSLRDLFEKKNTATGGDERTLHKQRADEVE